MVTYRHGSGWLALTRTATLCVMKRAAGSAELLDGPLDAAQLAGNLRDLEQINRLLGGSRASWRAVRWIVARSAHRGPVRMLDVGTGAADIPLDLLRRARRLGMELSVTATDVRPEIIDFARARATDEPGVDVVLTGDVPPTAARYDIAHASLVLHHLEPDDALRFLGDLGRAAPYVIVNDLDRDRRWWLAAWLMTRVATRNRYTRNDAPLSVRRAYRPDEIGRMAARAGLAEVARFRALLGHRYAIVLGRSG